MNDDEALSLRNLRIFMAVVRAESMSRAAEELRLSQPAVGSAVTRLEQSLGVTLFERCPAGTFRTASGERFAHRAERALALLLNGAQQASREAAVQVAPGFAETLSTTQARVLTAVAGRRHFSRAAQSLGVTQPAVHRAARDLEKLSGTTLFERVGRSVRPTLFALCFARHVRLAFGELNQALVEIAEWRGHYNGRINIGSLPLARNFILPQAITRFARDRPSVRFHVIDGSYEDLLTSLRQGEIDILIGALRDPPPFDDVEETWLLDDELAVVARAGHPLDGRARLTLTDLAGFPWVEPSHETPTRNFFDQLFPPGTLSTEVAPIEARSMDLVRGLLIYSDRLTMISAHQLSHERMSGELVVLPIDLSGMPRAIGITTRRDWEATETQRHFLCLLRETFRKA